MQQRTKALIFNLITIVCWSMAPVLIRYVSDTYPEMFQNFYRYLTSLIVMWGFAVARLGRGQLRADLVEVRKRLPKFFVMAGVNYVFQMLFTIGYYLVLPGFGTLVQQSGVLFSVVFAALLFPDERSTLRSMGFVVGLVLALGGVYFIITGGERLGAVRIGPGVLALVGCAVAWALLSSLIRKWLRGITPIVCTSTVFTLVMPFFLITYLATEGFVVPEAPPGTWLILTVSGFFGLGLGHSLYYMAVPVLGVATSSSLGLLIPLLAALISFFVYGEVLSVPQILGGIVLIGGSYVLIRTRFRRLNKEPYPLDQEPRGD
jgi:drug/metabolite transporter (DMT)-like permease